MLILIIFGGGWLSCAVALPLIVWFENRSWARDQRRLAVAWEERQQLEMAWLLPAYRRDKEFS